MNKGIIYCTKIREEYEGAHMEHMIAEKLLEIALKKILPPHESSDFCHRLVLFGREICKARKPLCENCTLQEGCAFWQKNNRRSNMASI